MTTLIINIKELLQVRETGIAKVSGAEMAILPTIKNAFLLLKDNLIADFGVMDNVPQIGADKVIDADKAFDTVKRFSDVNNLGLADDVLKQQADVRLLMVGDEEQVRQALQAAIKQRAMRGRQLRGQTRFIDRKAMILARNKYLASAQILHGMIRTVVAKFHFDCFCAARQSQ